MPDSSITPSHQTVRSSRQTIQYSRQGAGEPIVLVHGIGHRREAWAGVPDVLAQTHDVIAIDLPGFGQSPPPSAADSYSLASQADQLERLFRELGLNRPHVAGNSLGGYLCLELARRGSVRSATLLSPAGFWSPLGWVWAAVMLVSMKALSYAPLWLVRPLASRATLRRALMRTVCEHGERLTPADFLGDSMNLRRSAGFWPNFRRSPRITWTRQTSVPTTVAWGDQDKLLPPAQARRAAKRLPQATHVTLPGAGHVPMIDDPGLVASTIRATIERADRLTAG